MSEWKVHTGTERTESGLLKALGRAQGGVLEGTRVWYPSLCGKSLIRKPVHSRWKKQHEQKSGVFKKNLARESVRTFLVTRDRKPNANSLKQKVTGLLNCKQLKSRGVSETDGSRGSNPGLSNCHLDLILRCHSSKSPRDGSRWPAYSLAEGWVMPCCSRLRPCIYPWSPG